MDLITLLKEVEADLAKDRLAKADDDKDPGAEAVSASAAPASDGPGAPAADPAAAPEGPASPDAPLADGAAPADPATSADPASEDSSSAPPDLGALKAEYEQLPDDELQMHYLAVKAALFAKQGSSSPSPGQSATDPSSMAPADAGADQSTPPPPAAMKSEMGAAKVAAPSPGNGAMEKSEAKMVEMEKTIETLTKAVELMVGTPVRKAVKGVSELKFLSKTDETTLKGAAAMTKEQINAKLGEVCKKPSLSKSDRTAIIAYTLGNIDASKIEHLLA